MSERLKILWVNGKIENIPERIAELRRKLSPQGDIVSPKGRQKTIATFGEPLTPQEVVKRICTDISVKGLDALLDYNRRIDGADLTRETIRVPQSEIENAYKNADRSDDSPFYRGGCGNLYKCQGVLQINDKSAHSPGTGYCKACCQRD